MSGRAQAWPIAILLSAAAVGGLAVGGVGTPLRPIVTLGFLAVGPGLAIVRLLRIGDFLTEIVLSVAFSLALSTLVAGTMLYAGLWSPGWSLGLLLAVSGIGAALQLATPRVIVPGPTDEADSGSPPAPEGDPARPDVGEAR